MKTKLLFLVFLFISFFSCNNTQNSTKQNDKNVETYYGAEAAAMFINLPAYGSTATYRTPDGYAHWLHVNMITSTKYDYFYKIENEDDVVKNMNNGTMKITRNCNTEKEMVIITMLLIKADKSGEKVFPLIDNINDLTK